LQAPISRTSTGFLYQVYTLNFGANQPGLDRGTTLLGLTLASLNGTVTTPLFGLLSDRVGRKPTLIFGMVFSAAFSFAFFALVQPGVGWLFWLGMCLAMGVGVSAMFGSQGAFFSELFPAEHRFSGFGTSREIANALGAALTPLIALQLVAAFGGSTLPVSLYITAARVLALIGLAVAPRTNRASSHPPADTVGAGAPDERVADAS
jgi:MFS transporter, MHS family, shikimate and dehydroshikimate transport protein